MKKKSTEKLLNWDAHYAGIKATKERQQNCITLEELCLETLRQLYRFAPITIEDQIPVFTEWVVNGSSLNTASQRKNSSNKQKALYE